jgi:hypothetical protein
MSHTDTTEYDRFAGFHFPRSCNQSWVMFAFADGLRAWGCSHQHFSKLFAKFFGWFLLHSVTLITALSLHIIANAESYGSWCAYSQQNTNPSATQHQCCLTGAHLRDQRTRGRVCSQPTSTSCGSQWNGRSRSNST